MKRQEWEVEYQKFRKSDVVGGFVCALLISLFLWGTLGRTVALPVFPVAWAFLTLGVWLSRRITL